MIFLCKSAAMAVIKYKDVVIMKRILAFSLALIVFLSLPLSAAAASSTEILEKLIDDLDDTATLDNAAAICYAGSYVKYLDEGEALPPNIEKLERLERELVDVPFSVAFCVDFLRSYLNAHDSFRLISSVPCAKSIRNNEECYYYQVMFTTEKADGTYYSPIEWLIVAKPEKLTIDFLTSGDPEYFDLNSYVYGFTDKQLEATGFWSFYCNGDRLAAVLGCE